MVRLFLTLLTSLFLVNPQWVLAAPDVTILESNHKNYHEKCLYNPILSRQTNPPGTQCHRGHRGHRGHHGKQGPQGPPGPQGATGANASCITYGKPTVIWVDGNTSVSTNSQDGTLCKPFSTIQAAINQIESVPSITFDDLVRSWAVMIADGIYDEDISIQGDNRWIFLIALGNIVIGNPGNNSTRTLTWNLTPANRGSRELPSLLSLASVNSNSKGFILFGSVAVTNSGTNFGDFIANFFDPADTGTFTVSNTGPIDLYFISTIFHGPITGNASTNLQQALNSLFQDLVTVNNYGSIQGCSFQKGLTITTTTGPLAGTEPEGIIQTFFDQGSTLISTNSVANIFELDTYTNFWVKNNCSGGGPPAAQKRIIFDSVP